MPDNLKQYIESSRSDFDLYTFDEQDQWEQLSKELMRRKRVIPWKRYMLSGVAACFMFVAGWFSFMVFQGQSDTVSPQALEWLEAEKYYQQQIDLKLSEVHDKVDNPLLLADFNDLDKALNELREDLKDNVDNEEVILGMIEHYRLKLKILERMLDELNENETNETKDITS